MSGPHMAVTPGMIEAADAGDIEARARCYSHCAVWLSSGARLPPELAAWLVPQLSQMASLLLSAVQS